MSNIVERLRAVGHDSTINLADISYEAADEIKRLRGEADSWKAESRAIHALLFEKDAEIERLRRLVKTLTKADPRHDLAAENVRLRTALAFYAKPENYLQGGWQGDPDPTEVDKDAGKLARSALDGEKG